MFTFNVSLPLMSHSIVSCFFIYLFLFLYRSFYLVSLLFVVMCNCSFDEKHVLLFVFNYFDFSPPQGDSSLSDKFSNLLPIFPLNYSVSQSLFFYAFLSPSLDCCTHHSFAFYSTRYHRSPLVFNIRRAAHLFTLNKIILHVSTLKKNSFLHRK